MATLTERPVLIGIAADITATDGALYGEGALAYATDTNQAYRYTGSAWATEADADTVAANLATEVALTATYRPLFSQITANSAARNATTTLLDSGLTVTLPAVGTYELDALVMYITAAAADISFKWGGTATVTATVGTSDIVAYPGALAGGDGSTPGLGILLPTSWTTESETPFANTAAHTATPIYFKGILTATAVGTVLLQFTQGTSDVSDTKIKAGSWLKLQRVA